MTKDLGLELSLSRRPKLAAGGIKGLRRLWALCRCGALEEAQWQAALTGRKPREALGALGVLAEPGGGTGNMAGDRGLTKFSEHENRESGGAHHQRCCGVSIFHGLGTGLNCKHLTPTQHFEWGLIELAPRMLESA